jgi:AhpD family alkylhydroperoxidase
MLVRRLPYLVTAYLVPGRVPPRVREAAMLGVTSVNRCPACARVHERWGRAAGLPVEDPLGFARDEASAHTYGQRLAIEGPEAATPPFMLSLRHRRELEAAGVAIELANLAGNRFLPDRGADRPLQIGGAWTALFYDFAMRAVDRAGIRRARVRIAGRASGDVLEIGVGTGLNLSAYPAVASLHGIDPSEPALAVASRRAGDLGRRAVLVQGDAAILPYPDRSFDVVVATFVLCSVGDVGAALAEARRVLRAGGTLRLLEHARSRNRVIAWLQGRLAPSWARTSGGCRLDHDVGAAVRQVGLRVVEERSRGSGLLVEIVAAA